MRKNNKIRLTESQLKDAIKESIKKVMNENESSNAKRNRILNRYDDTTPWGDEGETDRDFKSKNMDYRKHYLQNAKDSKGMALASQTRDNVERMLYKSLSNLLYNQVLPKYHKIPQDMLNSSKELDYAINEIGRILHLFSYKYEKGNGTSIGDSDTLNGQDW